MGSGFDVDITSDVAGVTRYLAGVQHKSVPKATVMALNKTLGNVATQARRDIAKKMGLTQKRVKLDMFNTPAKLSSLLAVVNGKGKPLNLINFKARKTAKGVRASPYGKRKLYRKAFIGNKGRTVFMRNVKRVGYMRARKGRNKHTEQIIPMWGPSIPRTMITRAVMESMRNVAGVKFRINFDRSLSFLLAKGVL